MSEKVFFTLPCKPCVTLRLPKSKLTFFNEYSDTNVLTAKSVAQIGFDICEAVHCMLGDAETVFRELTGISLDGDTVVSSKYASAEAKVFEIINENTAIYSLGVLLRDLLISTGRSDMRLRAILDKACERYSFARYESFCDLKEDLAIYLKSEINEDFYGVMIVSEKPLPEPSYTLSCSKKAPDEASEAVTFKPYTRTQEIWHNLPKRLTLSRIQIILAVFFIVFSSISIPVTSVRQSRDMPTFSISQSI